VEEPPDAGGRSEDEQADDLIAPVDAPLPVAPLLLGDLLLVRLDAGFNHGAFSMLFACRHAGLPRLSIGEGKICRSGTGLV